MRSASATRPSVREAPRTGTVTIDVVSDAVCPWCYIGKRRLEAAIEQSGEAVEIRWRPFQLDPTIPPAGLDRSAYLGNKFGSPEKVDTIHHHLTETGRELGVSFAFDRIARSPNTLDAHRLIRWAASAGTQDQVVEALFEAYFEAGRDIGDARVLLDIATTCGMDRTLVHRLLASGTDSREVRGEMETAVRLGVSGVPFFIFAGRYAVPGAQNPEVLAAAIVKVRDHSPEIADA